MKLNEKIIKKIWKEFMSTLIIATVIIVVNGLVQAKPEMINIKPTNIALNSEKNEEKIVNEPIQEEKIVNEPIRKPATTKEELQDYAHELIITMGWSETDFQNLIKLWQKESGWNPNAHNKSSGAHGIPQSLPASKMSKYGDDYYTNGETQIKWGLNYILNRYGTPTKAWKHFQDKNWY